mmetsp:Transcript_6/g.14  ORF Transcript_6/g.14 Transcript_6/m.14 type:complete len:225 (-) Transcript_6:140-814(-)
MRRRTRRAVWCRRRVEKPETEESVIELHQVDTGDIIKVKQVLDETVVSTLITTCDLKENHRLGNIKLILMAVACAFAAVAQFAPVPFPENRPLLGVCGTIYFIISGILQLILWFVDEDAIMITYPDESIKETKGLRVRTVFPRYTEFFTLMLEYEDNKELKKKGQKPVEFVKETWSVGNFFDVDGYFDAAGFDKAVARVYERFKKKQFDVEDDEFTGNNKQKKD